MSDENTSKQVSKVIKVLNTGIDFYTEAQDKVESTQVATVFGNMATIRKSAVTRLNAYTELRDGETEEGGDFASEARRMYTNLIASIKSDSDYTYISQLEEIEDKTLEELKSALNKDLDPGCRAALSEIMAEMNQCHDRMLALQKSRE